MKLVVNSNVEDIKDSVVYHITTEQECLSFAKQSGATNSNRLLKYFKEYGDGTCFRLVRKNADEVTALVAGIGFYVDMCSNIIRYRISQRSE